MHWKVDLKCWNAENCTPGPRALSGYTVRSQFSSAGTSRFSWSFPVILDPCHAILTVVSLCIYKVLKDSQPGLRCWIWQRAVWRSFDAARMRRHVTAHRDSTRSSHSARWSPVHEPRSRTEILCTRSSDSPHWPLDTALPDTSSNTTDT